MWNKTFLSSREKYAEEDRRLSVSHKEALPVEFWRWKWSVLLNSESYWSCWFPRFHRQPHYLSSFSLHSSLSFLFSSCYISRSRKNRSALCIHILSTPIIVNFLQCTGWGNNLHRTTNPESYYHSQLIINYILIFNTRISMLSRSSDGYCCLPSLTDIQVFGLGP